MLLADSSTARLSIVKQPGKTNAVPSSPSWVNLPITSTTMSEQLEGTDSEVLRPDRQYANARILNAQSGGDAPVEVAMGDWLDLIILGALQSSSNTIADGGSVYNESTKHYFSLEKFFVADDGDVYQWFKDQQVNSLNFQFDSNGFVTATPNFMGLEVEPLGTAAKTGATYDDVDLSDQFDTNAASIVLKDSAGNVIEAEVESGSLEISNGLRKQPAVGKMYGAGNASSRFSCVFNGSIYFANRKIYEGFKANSSFQIEITLTSPSGASYTFVMGNCKVTTYDDNVGGTDTDIMISAAFRANADDQTPSRSLTVSKDEGVVTP